MFTSIMNGVIGEVTRHPASAAAAPQRKRDGEPAKSVSRLPRRVVRAAPRVVFPGKYRVFAESFKRAAGFY